MKANDAQKDTSNGRFRFGGLLTNLASLAGIVALAVGLYQTRNDLKVAKDTTVEQQTVEALLVEQRDLMATVAASNSDSTSKEATLIASINDKLSNIAPGVPTAPILKSESTPVPTSIVNSSSTTSISELSPTEALVPTGEVVVLANNVDNTYTWDEGSPYLTTKYVYEGDVAFIPTGNNHFEKDLGIVGYETNEVRYIAFKLYMIKADAALLLQVYSTVNSWNHRWGFDNRPTFNGYGWSRMGQTVNLPVGEWIDVKLDLIDDLGIKPGEHVIGLAFSSNDGNVVYDKVVLMSSEN